jgi:hypothetical protein
MDFAKLFKSVEDAIYEVMVWLLLLPKTLIRVTFRPRWAMKYIDEEWGKKPDERFDEYLSPVMLWLLSAVIPLTLAFILSRPDIKSAQDFLKALSNDIYSTTLYMMLIPFMYIVWVEWLNKTPVRRSSLKVSFYRHCYALAPAQILTVVLSGVSVINPLMIFAVLLVIPFYEAFVYQMELNIGYGRAFLYALIPQAILAVVFIFLVGALLPAP